MFQATPGCKRIIVLEPFQVGLSHRQMRPQCWRRGQSDLVAEMTGSSFRIALQLCQLACLTVSRAAA